VDKTKNKGFRFKNIFDTAKNLECFDMAFSFRGSFYSKLLLFFMESKKKYQYDKKLFYGHQVQKYNSFINFSLKSSLPDGDLKLYFEKEKFKKPTLGLNPGAAYGSAKRWYPKEFAKVAIALSEKFDILIFGSSNEEKMASDIEKELRKKGVLNYKNLAGKTSIEELAAKIAGLSLFITNDSGPMHIAAAFKVPTIAIFGPTDYKETSPWRNEKAIILSKNLECSPCKKRVCPLKTHECMKSITAEDVLAEIEKRF